MLSFTNIFHTWISEIEKSNCKRGNKSSSSKSKYVFMFLSVSEWTCEITKTSDHSPSTSFMAQYMTNSKIWSLLDHQAVLLFAAIDKKRIQKGRDVCVHVRV